MVNTSIIEIHTDLTDLNSYINRNNQRKIPDKTGIPILIARCFGCQEYNLIEED